MLAASISQLRNLKEFVCGRSRLENKGASSISKALSTLNQLEISKLNQNGIGVSGMKAIASVLMKNSKTLQVLDLSDNTIKADGAKALARALRKVEKLRILHLDDDLLRNDHQSLRIFV